MARRPRSPVTAVTAMVAVAALGVPAIAGCSSGAATATPAATATGDAAPAAATGPTATTRGDELTKLLAAAAPSRSVKYAVALVNNRTGEVYTYHGDETFATASVVKVDILATPLRKQDGSLTESQTPLADAMIHESDNDAATTLWGEIGGVEGLDATDDAIGLTDTTPGADGWWGYTTTTVADQVKLVNAVSDPDGLLGDASATVTDLMGAVVSTQDWGISAAARDGETFILKNGWMSRSDQDDLWTVNSIGRITGTDTDITMAVMSEGSESSDAGIAFVEKVAKLARDTRVR
jgi:Beta-lactamase enzyme family